LKKPIILAYMSMFYAGAEFVRQRPNFLVYLIKKVSK
jgi:hypothetical protein